MDFRIVTVLRSGGEYKPEHVKALRDNCAAVMPTHDFVCFSDCEVPCERIPLQTDWPRWWPKLEMFRELTDGAYLYLDLDTVVIRPLKLSIAQGEFWMLKDFGKPEPASGMMAWQGDFSEIFHGMKATPRSEDWDQRHIAKYVKPKLFQEHISGIYSYKKHCKIGLPEDAKIVCFHGKPRPWQVSDEWVKYGKH